jgi:hypothetical protein
MKPAFEGIRTGGGNYQEAGNYERKSQPIEIKVRPLQASEVEQIRPILLANKEQPLDEVEEVIGYMNGGQDEYGRIRQYFVAHDAGGQVAGILRTQS